MKRNPAAICATCPYWDPMEGNSGACLVAAPTIQALGAVPFPVMPHNGTCGRHPEFLIHEDEQPGNLTMGSKNKEKA